MSKAKKKAKFQERLPDRASDLSVSQGSFDSFREEVMAKFRSHDRRFDSVDKRFDSVDKRFDSLEAKIDAGFHRVISLIEEQNHRNKIALDGYQFVYEGQKALEKRVDAIDETMAHFKKISK